MSKDELIDLFESFINEQSLVPEFNSFAASKGFTEQQIDNVLSNLEL